MREGWSGRCAAATPPRSYLPQDADGAAYARPSSNRRTYPPESTRATISRIENSHPTSIDLVVLEKLARALEVDPSYLIVSVPDAKRGRGR